MSTQLQCTKEQLSAIKSIDKHVLVSAGAGSGKTFVLVERYLEILRNFEELDTTNIIAVTYTRKAAEEMRSRLKLRLKSLKEEEPLLKKRWESCLIEIENARIGTIHSLCETLLRSYPIESAIDSKFEILNELERAELHQSAIDEALQSVISNISNNENEILKLFEYPIETLHLWLKSLLSSPMKYRECRAAMGDLVSENLRSKFSIFVKTFTQVALNNLANESEFKTNSQYILDCDYFEPDSKIFLKQKEVAKLINIFNQAKDKSDYENCFYALQKISDLAPAGNIGGPKAAELRQSLRYIRERASSFVKDHAIELNDADAQAGKLIASLIQLADDALFRYESGKKQLQKLDFDDLIVHCQEMLQKKPGNLVANLKGILIDEFQDTNWIQARLLSLLASSDTKLFLIGDDKQSIYKFQGADVGTFNSCKNYIDTLNQNSKTHELFCHTHEMQKLEGQGLIVSLNHSFRSHPQIVSFINYLFANLFLSKNFSPGTKQGDNDSALDLDQYKASFQALIPFRQDLHSINSRVEIIFGQNIDLETYDRSSIEARMEANDIASWILEKIEKQAPVFDKKLNDYRPIRYSDFACLLQTNSDFSIIEEGLSQANIPFVSVSGSGFLDRQEIYDLENMLKFVHCPQDSHSLFGLLRSPMFGFSDDLLYEIIYSQKDLSLWDSIINLTKSSMTQVISSEKDLLKQDLIKTVEILQEFIVSSQFQSLDNFLENVISKTNYDAVLLSTKLGRQKSRNLWKFLQFAQEHRNLTLSEFLQVLNRMRELGIRNLTDAPLSADNAVLIMTIHRSKGLEFAALALPRLNKMLDKQAAKLLFAKEFGIAFDTSREESDEKPAFYRSCHKFTQMLEQEEKKRLLYVALTRARDYLALFIPDRRSKKDSFATWLIETLGLDKISNTNNTQQSIIVDDKLITSFNLLSNLETRKSDLNQELSNLETSLTLDTALSTSDSLLKPLAKSFTYNLLPFQKLLRVTPANNNTQIHSTILGSYFHLLMAHFATHKKFPDKNMQKALAMQSEISCFDTDSQSYLESQSKSLIEKFNLSQLCTMIYEAKNVLVEETYILLRSSNALFTESRPDLILEDKNGNWHIIDYKTDQFKIENLEQESKKHEAQMLQYLEDIKTLLGIDATAWLYFAFYGQLQKLSFSKTIQLKLNF